MRIRCVFYLVLLTLVLNTACIERTIDPFEDEVGSFSIYGAINLSEEENFIRIKNLLTPFWADTVDGYQGLIVALTDVQDGTELAIYDSVVNYSGNFTHNYLIQDTLRPDDSYLFEINTPDDQIISSTFKMPSTTRVTKSFLGIVHENTQELSFPVPDCSEKIKFIWTGFEYPQFIIPEVGFNYDGRTFWREIRSIAEIEFVPTLDSMVLEMSVDNLLAEIWPPEPIERWISVPTIFWVPSVGCDELESNEVYIRYRHFSEDWEQFYDTRFYYVDILESDSVNNGLGFLGGLRTDEFEFTITDVNN